MALELDLALAVAPLGEEKQEDHPEGVSEVRRRLIIVLLCIAFVAIFAVTMVCVFLRSARIP